MAERRKLSNPLALTVMVLLAERSMHPYEIAQTLRRRGKQHSVKTNVGSLHTVVQNLEKHGYVEVAGVQREGNRPERTLYGITEGGRVEMLDWLSDLIAVPAEEFPASETALALLPVLPPQEVETFLGDRSRRRARRPRRCAECSAGSVTGCPVSSSSRRSTSRTCWRLGWRGSGSSARRSATPPSAASRSGSRSTTPARSRRTGRTSTRRKPPATPGGRRRRPRRQLLQQPHRGLEPRGLPFGSDRARGLRCLIRPDPNERPQTGRPWRRPGPSRCGTPVRRRARRPAPPRPGAPRDRGGRPEVRRRPRRHRPREPAAPGQAPRDARRRRAAQRRRAAGALGPGTPRTWGST